jgi:hypothetical protein
MSSQSYFFNPQDDRMSCAGSGLQLPRLSSTQRLALTVGVNDAGLQVFDTTLQAELIWNGTSWGTSVASFTTAQLLALSASESAAVGIAYCTDCLTTKGLLTDVGDFVFWNGLNWTSVTAGVEITTELPLFSLRLFIKYPGVSTFPGGPMNWAGLSGQNIVSGAGATVGTDSTPTGDGKISTRVASTGTTAVGVARRVFQGFVPNPSNSQSRHITLVQGYNFVDVSAAPDTWHYRDSIETFQSTATAALQSDMCSLIYDASNILGLGSTGANRFALTRGNGTTFDWVDTGVIAANPHHTILTAELTGVNQIRMQAATALSNGGGYQVVVDRTVTVSGANMQTVFAFAKATGTNSKTSSRVNNAQWTAIKANSTPATTVLS